MRTVMRFLWRAAFGLAIAGALAFGSHQATASPATTCGWNPPTLLGSCVDNYDCTLKCYEVNGDEEEWFGWCTPTTHCCVCYL